MHFKDAFNKDVDVIYGTGLWIHIYLYNFYFGWGPGQVAIGKADIDFTLPPGQFDPLMSKAHDKYGTNVINVYNEPIHTKTYTVDKATKTVAAPSLKPVKTTHDTQTQTLANDYLTALKACKHLGPDSIEGAINDRLVGALRKYEKLSKTDFSPASLSRTTADKVAYTLYDVCIRRSCKYGVFYFTHVKHAKLHYILDEMDIATIVDKTMLLNDTANAKKVPICTSELRYIFRHWNHLKGGSLKFYDQYDECGAPWSDARWETHRERWADYAIARVEKFRARIVLAMNGAALLLHFDEQVAQFKLLRAPVTAEKVVSAFHALPATLTNNPADDTIPK